MRKHYKSSREAFYFTAGSEYLYQQSGKSLGIRLFGRVGKKFVLTCAGELYVEKARKMLALKAEFDEALSEIAGGKRGRLWIGVQLRRETWLIPPVLPRFKRE